MIDKHHFLWSLWVVLDISLSVRQALVSGRLILLCLSRGPTARVHIYVAYLMFTVHRGELMNIEHEA
jgi:hypothetical protein